jgi:hypothetical protein
LCEGLLGGTNIREQRRCKTAQRVKGSGSDTVEVEAVADDVRTQDLAAVVFDLVVAL